MFNVVCNNKSTIIRMKQQKQDETVMKKLCGLIKNKGLRNNNW